MTWAIGDLQGCFSSFMELLREIEFNPSTDKLWLAGDLVNRGKGSLETIEYIYEHQNSIVSVLGNHDISLIAAYFGLKASNETLDPILNSPRVNELVGWLRKQKIFHRDTSLGYCMAHAGIAPNFTINDAIYYANSIENHLRADSGAKDWLKGMMQTPKKIKFGTTPKENEIFALSSFLRMRYCFEDGSLEMTQKGSPSETKGLVPWFLHSKRKEIKEKIIFGHWSTLGFYQDQNVTALDTGCVWGGRLSAMCLEDGRVCSVLCG